MTPMDSSTRAAVFLERVTVRNFKGIEELEVELEPGLSLLVGRNNAGKSRILRALHIAVGGAEADRDDLTVGSRDPAEIDVILAPKRPGVALLAGGGEASRPAEEVFEPTLLQLFGQHPVLVSESPERQRFAWRTTIDSISDRAGARSQHICWRTTRNSAIGMRLPIWSQGRALPRLCGVGRDAP